MLKSVNHIDATSTYTVERLPELTTFHTRSSPSKNSNRRGRNNDKHLRRLAAPKRERKRKCPLPIMYPPLQHPKMEVLDKGCAFQGGGRFRQYGELTSDGRRGPSPGQRSPLLRNRSMSPSIHRGGILTFRKDVDCALENSGPTAMLTVKQL
jgi:hypothetical protein